MRFAGFGRPFLSTTCAKARTRCWFQFPSKKRFPWTNPASKALTSFFSFPTFYRFYSLVHLVVVAKLEELISGRSGPIQDPGQCEVTEPYKLMTVFTTSNFSFSPNSHNAPAAQWVFQMDLCLSWPHWFVRQTNPWVLFLHKSIWNTHGAAGSLWLFGAKQKLLVVKKTSSLYHSRHSYGPGTLIGIDFHPETAEK